MKKYIFMICVYLMFFSLACKKAEGGKSIQDKQNSFSAEIIPEEKNDIVIEKLNGNLKIKDLNYSLTEAIPAAQLADVEILFLNHCDVRMFKDELKYIKHAKVLWLSNCVLDGLEFLDKLPSLEVFHASSTSFPRRYGELDLSKSKRLVYFYIDGMNFNIEFSRIKALPKSLEIFGTDALFERGNLPDLQRKGNEKLHFDILGTVDALELQGVKIGNIRDDWTYIKKLYAID